jgi:membrane protein YqaA with SNARE-associated domain
MKTQQKVKTSLISKLRAKMYALKDWTERLAAKPYALPALFFLSLAESSFFPIPPDVLLIALCVSLPLMSFKFAAICTIGSVLGGVLGFFIGYALWYDLNTQEYTALANLFFTYIPGFTLERFDAMKELYTRHDFWIVFAAGFTPIPYKIFTISSGLFGISLPMFIIASAIGRGGRFFLVALLFRLYGAKIKSYLDKYLEQLTLAFLVLFILGFIALKYVF